MKEKSTRQTNPGVAVDRHIVYGYVEKHPPNGKPLRWYVGITNNPNRRFQQHKKAEAKRDNGYFHKWIQAGYREGKKFKDILEYHELQVIHGTSREAEFFERKWTERKNALRPHGFNMKTGGYKGKFSEETREKHRAALNRPDVGLRNLLDSADKESA